MSDEKQKTFSLEEWKNTMPENFDLRAEFAAHVEPIIKQLQETCRQLGMPMLVLVSDMQNEIGTSIGGFQHFGSPARLSAAMIMALHASKLEYGAIVDIAQAARERSMASMAAQGSIAGVMASVTKH